MLDDFKTLGGMVPGCSYTTDKTTNEILVTRTDSQLMVCLLSRIVDQLDSMNRSIGCLCRDVEDLHRAKGGDSSDSDSDWSEGMITGLNMTHDDAIPSDLSMLSRRAVRSLIRSGVRRISEITPEKFNMRGCGVSTIRELMDFKSMKETECQRSH